MPAVVESFVGKWTEESSDNFEEYMKALDVNMVLRKIGKNTKANEEWIVEGDQVTLKITSTFKNKTLCFELGKEIDEETLDGRNVKTTFSEEGGKLIHRQTGKPHNCTYVRELKDGNLLVTMTVHSPNEVTATRVFKRV